MKCFPKKYSSIILLVFFLSSGCKKIPVPDSNAKELFGQWKYVTSSGGIGGGSDPTFTTDNWIEFKESGKYQVHNKWRRIHCEKFKFETLHSQRTGNDETTIVYDKKPVQTFSISGNTLYLFDEYADGYTYTFVKK